MSTLKYIYMNGLIEILGGGQDILVDSPLSKDQYYYKYIRDLLTLSKTEGKTK